MNNLTVSQLKEEQIKTLGIPKSFRCSGCGKANRLSNQERLFIADAIVSNSAGMWALKHCFYCGWVKQIYPTRINGEPCSMKEIKKLEKELEKFVEEYNK